MEAYLLLAHNLLRWLVLLSGALMLIVAFRGWQGTIPWRPQDDRLNKVFVGLFDLEVFAGGILYVISKATAPAFHDFSKLFANKVSLFFGLEHPITMIVALTLVHAGSIMGRRAEGATRFRRLAIMYSLALALVLSAIPWSFRPLFRWPTL